MTTKPEFNFRKYLKIIAKRKYLFVIIALAVMTGVACESYLLPEKYEAKCSVFIEKSVISDLVKGIAITPSFEDKIRVLAYAMKSRTLLLRVFDDLDMNISKLKNAQLESRIKSFQDRTDIKLKDREGLFIISFYDENPKLARDYVNTLVRRYIEENVSSKKEDSYDATKYLGEQIATVKEKLDKAEARLNVFRKAKENYLVEKDYEVMHQIDSAQQKLDDLDIRRNQLVAMREKLNSTDPIQTKLAAMQRRLHELNVIYTDNYPEVIELRNEIESTREHMRKSKGMGSYLADANQPDLEKISMEMKSLSQQERNLKHIISSKQALQKNIPSVKTELEGLEQEKAVQQKLYDELMGRYGQSEVSKQMQLQDKATTFRIVDPAVTPAKPFSPNRVALILLGMVAGLAISFGILVLMDYLDNSVRTVDTFKTMGVPVLAVVPKIKNSAEIMVTRQRNLWFFTAAGAYFAIILTTLSVEYLRQNSISLIDPAIVRQNLSLVKDMILK